MASAINLIEEDVASTVMPEPEAEGGEPAAEGPVASAAGVYKCVHASAVAIRASPSQSAVSHRAGWLHCVP